MAIALPAGIVNGLFPQNQMQTTSEPFQWGSGGRRMTPEDIARERKIAASLMQSDYSPVQHWTQGLGRVADNVLGALRDRETDKAVADNQAYSRSVAELLANPGGTPSASAPPGSPQSSGSGGNLTQLMQIVADPYVDAGTKALAQMQLEQGQKIQMKELEWANRERPEIVQLAQIANDPASPDWMKKAAADRITALNDPLAIVPDLGGGIGGYVGPRSQLGPTVERQMGGSAPSNTGDVIADPRKGAGGTPSVKDAPRPSNTIARSAYEAFVTQFGQEEADAILKRNGLSVGGY